MPPIKTKATTTDDTVIPTGATFSILTGALKAFEKEVNGETRKYLSCTASSTIKDLHGDIMTDECVMDMAPQAKQKAMTIFLNHSYKVPEDVFGKTMDAKIISRSHDDDGRAVYDLDLEIALDESNPRTLSTYASIKDQGIKLGVSIGAIIEDWEFIDEEEGWWGGLRIKQVNLLEASIVGIPANQRSWVINGLKALGAPKAIIEKALGKADKPKAATRIGEIQEVDQRYFIDGLDVTTKLDVISTSKTAKLNNDGNATLKAAPFKSWTIKSDDPDDDGSTAPDEEITDDTESSDADDKASETTASATLADATAAVATLRSTDKVDESLLEIVLSFLEGATEEVATLRKQLKDVTDERDQARQEVAEAAEIVETIARTPIGRKAQFAAPVESFRARFAGYYPEGYLKLLDEGTQEA